MATWINSRKCMQYCNENTISINANNKHNNNSSDVNFTKLKWGMCGVQSPAQRRVWLRCGNPNMKWVRSKYLLGTENI